jgi:hypothetical protein
MRAWIKMNGKANQFTFMLQYSILCAAEKQTFSVYEMNEFDRDSPAFLEFSSQTVNRVDPRTGAHVHALGDQVPFTNKVGTIDSCSKLQLEFEFSGHINDESRDCCIRLQWSVALQTKLTIVFVVLYHVDDEGSHYKTWVHVHGL